MDDEEPSDSGPPFDPTPDGPSDASETDDRSEFPETEGPSAEPAEPGDSPASFEAEGVPSVDLPAEGPPEETFANAFTVYEVQREGNRLLYFGQPEDSRRHALRELWPAFREEGYELHVRPRLGETVLVAEPFEARDRGFPWTNTILFLATVLSTLLVGAYGWYYIPPGEIADNPLVMLEAWPFAAAVLGVLGVHELGHYAMSKYHDVDASLPYFIPMPTIIGTMGAVIKMRGQMPDRKALFDIGVAGPLAGLAATIVVTMIGLWMDPITVPDRVLENSEGSLIMRNPMLLELIAGAMGAPMVYDDPTKQVNPVVIGGWVGMFVTALNLIPVGQLDGGHMLRAMLGPRQESIGALVPLALFGLAGYLYYALGLGLQDSVLLWAIWGGLAMLMALNGPAHPIDDSELGWRRQLVGLITFGLGALCFTPIPFEFVPA